MIRPALYATGITVRNFRGYGEFELPLPAGPCAVILSGPNGLGKTSLFEAIEWGLTGAVKRLDLVADGKPDPRNIARRAEGVEAAEVSLSYRDEVGAEERVQRTQLVSSGASVPDSHGTKLDAVADLLRSDEARWNVNGRNLADYLHLTHLHAQVAALRLVTFSAKERWVRVSPLAGADRFERVRTNLTSSKAALTKLKDRRAEAFQEAVARRERWSDLLMRLEQSQKLVAAMRDVLAPRDAIRTTAELSNRLGIPAAPARNESEEDLSNASQAIRTVRIAVERGIADVDTQLENLGRLRVLPRQVLDIASQRSGLSTRLHAMEGEIERLSRNVEDLAHRALDRKAASAEASRLRKAAVDRHERLARAVRDREDLARLDEELADAERQLREADKKLEEAEVELRRRRDELAAYDALAAAHERARLLVDEVERAATALLEVEATQRRIETEQGRRDILLEQQRTLNVAAEALSGELRTLDEQVDAAERVLEQHRRAAAAFQQALHAIAEHITDNDTACPVCRTVFDHGRLRTLARSSVEALDPHLADAESRLGALREEREHARSRSLLLVQDKRKVAADLRAIVESLTELDSRIGSLAKIPLVGGTAVEDTRKRIAQARTERQSEAQRLQRELASKAQADDLRKAVSAAGVAVDALVRDRSLTHERRLARQTRSDEVRARIAQASAEFPELDNKGLALTLFVQEAALGASNAKEAADAASVSLAEASVAEAAERMTLAASNEELARIRAQTEALDVSLEAAAKQWRAAGLADPVSDAALDAEVERHGRRRRELDAVLAELSKISAALERWQHTEELQKLEAEVRREHGALERDAYAKELDATVANARAAAAAAQRARDAADELSGTLGKITADFGERALRPFDELFRRYLRALVHDERFHSIEATYEPSARAASLRFRVDLGGSDTDAEYILSEGQLGEVSLAAMLAASTTFPWSRWRALLLDDPTQYHDLIHATALFDVLRNLVRFAGYQIIVSTHDNEQAGFLRRKLDAVRIPWIDCRYIAHEPEGIVTEIRSSDGVGHGLGARAS